MNNLNYVHQVEWILQYICKVSVKQCVCRYNMDLSLKCVECVLLCKNVNPSCSKSACFYFCEYFIALHGFTSSTAEAVLQKMDDMQKMRRRLRSRDSKEEVGSKY